MVVKHCAYGKCNSDNRYMHRPQMQGVCFYRFPNKDLHPEKCKRWIHACGRKGLTFSSVKSTKFMYICSLHFHGRLGPTEEFPDPISASASDYREYKISTTMSIPQYTNQRHESSQNEPSSVSNQTVCPQCGKDTNETTSRLIQDSCGHTKCRNCILTEDAGCLMCRLKSKSTGSAPPVPPAPPAKPVPAPESVIVQYVGQQNAALSAELLLAVQKKKRKPLIVQNHITILDGDPPMYQCNICKKKFKTKAHVKYHESCKTGEKPFKCGECGQGYVSKAHYEYHKLTHTGERPFPCHLCDKSFSQKAKLQRHLRSHTGERPYTCESCGRSFTNSQGLRSHKLVHTGEKPYKCQQCDKRFTGLTNLKKHTICHTGEKPYMCEDCGKSFGLKWSLELHQQSHKGSRPHRCGKCTRSFVNKKDLKRHQATHSELRPYSCPQCTTTFRRKDNLERHVKNTHTEEPVPVTSHVPESSAATSVLVMNSASKQMKPCDVTETSSTKE